MNIRTLTPQEATAEGYAPLTTIYKKSEHFMLENTVADMVRGNIDFCLVSYYEGREVWRRPSREVKP
jgi:hypothetical protein